MDKLPIGIRNKFLKKQAAASTTSSGTTSTPPLHSGTESQIFTQPSSPEIPFPQSNLEECLACESRCPPEEQAKYPSYIINKIDHELPLAGSVKPYGRHILISTGNIDWMHSIDENDGSITQGIHRGLYNTEYGGRKRDGEVRIVLSNTSFAPSMIGSDRTEVMLMPEWKLIREVSLETSSMFVQRFIDGGGVGIGQFGVETLPFHSIVLICSHAKRDKRCGVTSKYLVKAFESGLRRRDIYRSFDDTRTEAQGGITGGGTVVGCLSHIGGHKFAGNVIIYRRRTKAIDKLREKLKELTLTNVEDSEDVDTMREKAPEDVQAEGIWLGRVEPKHVEPIIEEVVLKGRVFKELYRGGLPSKYAHLQF
jgi:Sucrase/ferredoxin-like